MKSFLILLLIATWLVLGYCLEPRLVPHVAAPLGGQLPSIAAQGSAAPGYLVQEYSPPSAPGSHTLLWLTDG